MTSSRTVAAPGPDSLPHIVDSSLVVKSEMLKDLFDTIEHEPSLLRTRPVAVFVCVFVWYVQLPASTQPICFITAAVDLSYLVELKSKLLPNQFYLGLQ